MKYFLHDSNAFEDEKVALLFMKYGYEGLGLFYTILEKLAKQEKPVNTEVLKMQLKVGKKLEKCWNFMESIDIISSNNGETFNKQLLNFSEKYKIKKEKNLKRISQWRENQDIAENVTHYKSVRNDHKEKKRKVNESKVNNIITVQPTVDPQTNFLILIEPYKNILSESYEEFIAYWCEPSKSGKLRYESEKFFDVKRRVNTWLQNRIKYGNTKNTDPTAASRKRMEGLSDWVNS
jgi:hypothetical protein